VPIRYDIDAPHRLIISTAKGSVTHTECESHQRQLLHDPSFDSKFNQLIDIREVTEFWSTVEEGLATRPVLAETSRRAWVVGKRELFKMLAGLWAKQMEAHSECRVFDDYESALDWLNAAPKMKTLIAHG
jgi:hypothetical protein